MVRQQVPVIASPIKMNENRVFDFLTFLLGKTLRKRIKEQTVSEARTGETIYFSVYCISDTLHMISWSLRCLLFWGHSWGCRGRKMNDCPRWSCSQSGPTTGFRDHDLLGSGTERHSQSEAREGCLCFILIQKSSNYSTSKKLFCSF